VGAKSIVAGVVLCFVLVGAGTYAMFWLTERNLSALKQVPALSWETVDLVWTYAWAATMLAVLLLTALAVILYLIGCALKCARC
jgi:uncharacterized membrane protein